MTTEPKKIPPLPYPLSRKMRLAIMFTLIGAFCIIAPLVILYARGYTYSFVEHKIIHGGALSIETEPPGASIFLNDIPLPTGSPARLSHILPGNYHVKITLPGFSDWEKDMSIVSNETSYLHDIDLFAQREPTLLTLSDKKIERLYPSPNQNFFLFSTRVDDKYEISLYNLKTSSSTFLTHVISSSTPVLSWSKKGEFLRIESQVDQRKNMLILNPENTTVTQTASFEGESQWDNGRFGIGLLYRNNQTIERIDLNSTRTLFSVATSTHSWFLGDNNTLWEYADNTVRHTSNDGTEIFSAHVGKPIKKFIDINESRIIGDDGVNITLYKFGSNTLIDQQTLPVLDTAFFEKQNYFLAWKDGELWAILPDGNAHLLNRFSETILEAIPFTSSGTILVVTQNKIFTFHPQYNIPQDLLKAEEIGGVSVDAKKRELYVLGVVKGVRGVWRLGY